MIESFHSLIFGPFQVVSNSIYINPMINLESFIQKLVISLDYMLFSLVDLYFFEERLVPPREPGVVIFFSASNAFFVPNLLMVVTVGGVSEQTF